MKFLATLFAVAFGHRINSDAVASLSDNPKSALLKSHEDFMDQAVGSGRMTSWTGDSTLAFVKIRRWGGAFARDPCWELYKDASRAKNLANTDLQDTKSDFFWQSWLNPFANSHRSIREGGDKKGPTINRIHYNQFRRKNARMRAFITTPKNRRETFYTMSSLGWFGKRKETKETGHHFNVRSNKYNMGVGKCSGNMKETKRCKGRLYTGKAFNFGYQIQVFKKDKIVAEATLADTPTGFKDKFFIGEKKRYDVKISAGQDNMGVVEFVGFIADLEEHILMNVR